MKKAKIVLSAIALVGIVGGAFAFQAKKLTVSYVICVSGGCVETADTVVLTDQAHSTTSTIGTTDLNAVGGECDPDCSTTLYFSQGV